MNEIKVGCIISSVDHPSEVIENGSGWWDKGANVFQGATDGVDIYSVPPHWLRQSKEIT